MIYYYLSLLFNVLLFAYLQWVRGQVEIANTNARLALEKAHTVEMQLRAHISNINPFSPHANFDLNKNMMSISGDTTIKAIAFKSKQ